MHAADLHFNVFLISFFHSCISSLLLHFFIPPRLVYFPSTHHSEKVMQLHTPYILATALHLQGLPAHYGISFYEFCCRILIIMFSVSDGQDVRYCIMYYINTIA